VQPTLAHQVAHEVRLQHDPALLVGCQSGPTAEEIVARLKEVEAGTEDAHAVVELAREAARGGVSGHSGAAGTAGLSDPVGRPAPAAPDTYSLWTEDATGRKWRYRFVDEPTPDTVFERHWLESFGKPTLNNICLTRMTPRGHIYLRKDFFKFTSPTAVEKRRIAQGREKLIEQEFGIGAEWVKAAQDLLDRNRARTGDSAGAGAEAGGRTGAQTGAWAPGRKEVAGG
jgi:hypothetical protein